MDKVTVHLPNGEMVTEQQMMYLYYHEATGTFSFDYKSNNGRFISASSHDFVHSLHNKARKDVHVFSVNSVVLSKIVRVPDYGMVLGNMLSNPLSPVGMGVVGLDVC